jgi:GTP cyclohydrolase III
MDRISQKIGIGRGIKAVDAIAKIQAAIENGKKDVTSSD